jgi:enoyl-CoA hydratase/carnithine racemase
LVSRFVLTERVGSIAILTLNRAERHNSLVPEFLEELLAVVGRVGGDLDVQAVILQANGRSFSTGGDLGAFHAHLADLAAYAGEIVGLLNQVILALVELPVPVVAAVHGIVTGGSLGLVLGCDVVLVAPEASFTPYYSVVGFSPDGGWTALLPAIIGPKRTAEVLLCNRTISAKQAVDWGLANCVIPAERIRDEALCVAREIATQRPGSLRHTKRLLSLAYGDPSPGSGQGLAAGLEAERAHFVQQIETSQARQGIADFIEGMRK